jgi:hypothetical protein
MAEVSTQIPTTTTNSSNPFITRAKIENPKVEKVAKVESRKNK